ncbi:hypothetical protein DKX38_019466 [Salix brachista]|uniref:Uncharacterized protein n=1 Tax=Salix brachista TaxID=2182728 RepID=A0A5N5KGC0_9ROSI|nr:hypothetical protein DKX38_019466 [Salix brachista]
MSLFLFAYGISPLPLAASTHLEFDLKTIFRPGPFREALGGLVWRWTKLNRLSDFCMSLNSTEANWGQLSFYPSVPPIFLYQQSQLKNTSELHCLCREIKQSRMDEKHKPNPAFGKESVRASLERLASSSVLNFCCDDSVIMQHGIFTLLVETLNSLIQAKYQTTKASPFDSHDVIMSVLLVALFTYATASVAEAMLLARESPYCTLVGNLRLFAGALAPASIYS